MQLLLLSLGLLSIPWGGYQYLGEMERFLRRAQSDGLEQTARAAAVSARTHEDLFMAGAVTAASPVNGSGILTRQLDGPIQLDGYDEDWRSYQPDRQRYTSSGDLAFDLLAGTYGDYLFLLVTVDDDQLLPWRMLPDPGLAGDNVELTLEQPDGKTRRIRVSPASPGWMDIASRHQDQWRPESRIRGQMQRKANGYQLELRLPGYLVGERMAVKVTDVDDPETRAVESRLFSSPSESIRQLGWLISQNSDLEASIAPLVRPGMRIWVVDPGGRVLASHGNLQSQQHPQSTPLQRFMTLLIRSALGQPGAGFNDDLAGRRRIRLPELDDALQGVISGNRRRTADGRAIIQTVAQPVTTVDGVIGAVLVEQSGNEILSLQSEAIKKLLMGSALLIGLTGMLLLGFATLLVVRIHRLRDRVEAAVGGDGRILGELSTTHANDEIGDLQRSFHNVMARLKEYNTYLEAMSARLAHELKTPLSITRSSLENLQLSADNDKNEQQVYIERAQQGIHRLSLTVDRMREASRLEQLIERADRERIDIRAAIRSLIEGYRSVYPDRRFELTEGTGPIWVNADVDLICQALEKLLANALDFQTPGSAIRLECDLHQSNFVCLRVINRGALLHEGVRQRLFQAMVSQRSGKSNEPHLGLGLYLVRLIAEFHDGEVSAVNLADGSGVAFELKLPAFSS